MIGWMSTRMNGWMDEWMGEQVYVSEYACMCMCVNGRMDG